MSSKGDIAEAPAMGNSSPNTRASQQRKKEPLKISRNKPKMKLQDIRDIFDSQIDLCTSYKMILSGGHLGLSAKQFIKVLRSASAVLLFWSSIVMVMA